MTKEYILQGLTCAGCAGKIEHEVSRIDSVRSASVSVITSSMVLELSDGQTADIFDIIKRIVHKHEPDVLLIDKAEMKVAARPETNIRTKGGADVACCIDAGDAGDAGETENGRHRHAGADADTHTGEPVDSHGHTHTHTREHTRNGNQNRSKIIRFIIGAVIFACGILSERLTGRFDAGNAHFTQPTYYIPYIHIVVYVISYIVLGGDIVLRALRNIARGQVFDENFLMGVATIGAFAIGEFSEAVAVMLFYQIGEFFQEAAVNKSKKSIAALMDIRPDYANVIRNGETIQVAPDTVGLGEVILVKPGEKIPLDGVIEDGGSMLDMAALTGESLPRSVTAGDAALSGCLNQTGALRIKVTKRYGESTVAKIIDLVENASSRKAPTESFITKFSRYYTPAVVIIAVLLAVVPPLLLSGNWAEWIRRGLVFLVISCPCALVISIPLGFFGGIGSASRKGILVKGGNYLEALNDLDIVVFDKTGTLTKGVFGVTKVYACEGYTENKVLMVAAHAESYSNHPIALSIAKAYGGTINTGSLRDYEEIAGHGVSVVLGGKKILAGNEKLMISEGIAYTPTEESGTRIYVALDGKPVGCIIISDEVRPDSCAAITGLKAKGVRKAVMLTGDNASIATEIAGALPLDEVYAELLPHEKVGKLEILDARKRHKGRLVFVGDGINDAPVLARADIGVAMGGLGSDAAIEAADIVLMTDEPSKLVTAVDVAKATRSIVWQNIIFALAVKGAFLLMAAFGIATMWEAVFADVGVALLAVLNAMRIMKK